MVEHMSHDPEEMGSIFYRVLGFLLLTKRLSSCFLSFNIDFITIIISLSVTMTKINTVISLSSNTMLKRDNAMLP